MPSLPYDKHVPSAPIFVDFKQFHGRSGTHGRRMLGRLGPKTRPPDISCQFPQDRGGMEPFLVISAKHECIGSENRVQVSPGPPPELLTFGGRPCQADFGKLAERAMSAGKLDRFGSRLQVNREWISTRFGFEGALEGTYPSAPRLGHRIPTNRWGFEQLRQRVFRWRVG